MDIFLMVRRKNQSMTIALKEEATVMELKNEIASISGRPVEEQMLIKDETELTNSASLGEYNINSQTAKPQTPALLGLCYQENGHWEVLDITQYSTPPELPDSLKNTEASSVSDNAN